MDSATPGAPGASGSKDAIHGLKFGKKIYFEDVAGGSSSKPATNVLAPPASGNRKGRGAAHGGQQKPPRCQVEGCNEDLTGAKTYYCRHKVCGMHSKFPKVVVAGKEQRFCQQCSRFHLLSEFDQGKRSCRRRLAGHNERRRKPPPGPLSRYGRLASSFHQNGGRFEGFLMDFSYPKLPVTTRDMWQTNPISNHVASNPWQGTMDGTPIRITGQPLHPYDHSPAGITLFSDHGISPSQCLAVSDSSCALSLLSNQPWGTNARSGRAPMIAADNFGGTQMAQPQPSLATGFVGNSWNLREHESSGMANEVPPDVGLGLTAESSDRHFSGELELALQGKRQCTGNGHDRAYCPGNMTQWSL